MFRSSWSLNECNLSCKIVKNCILSEVCKLTKKNRASEYCLPQMWRIKRIKGRLTRFCCQDFAKLTCRTQKIRLHFLFWPPFWTKECNLDITTCHLAVTENAQVSSLISASIPSCPVLHAKCSSDDPNFISRYVLRYRQEFPLSWRSVFSHKYSWFIWDID